MKQQNFESLNQQFWHLFSKTLDKLEKKRPLDRAEKKYFPHNYRTICHHLALAKARVYSASLIEYLHLLSMRGHRQFYRHKSHLLAQFWQYIRYDFPATFQAQWRFILIAHLLFYLPFFALAILTYFYPQVFEAVGLGYAEIAKENVVGNYQKMADAQSVGTNRALADNWLMFAYYVYNNIGIAFQAFAGGLIFGAGSLYMLLFNGLYIGGTSGLVANSPVAITFFSFVIAHGAFELTGLVIAGAGGLKLGWTLLCPGPFKRLDALKREGRVAISLMNGAFFFLFIAAIIEGFWSPITNIPYLFKFIIGTLLWIGVYTYLLFSRKRQ